MSFVRIRLTFQGPLPLSEVKNCWFLVDTSTCNTIADLEYLIKKRFKAFSKSCTSVDLFLDDYLLPSQEKIEIIQNNDNIRVEMKQATIKQDEESDDQATCTKKKAKSKKEDRHLPDPSNKSKRRQVDDSEEVFSETKKKRKKLPETETQDGNATKKHSKKEKKKKASSQESKNPVKEPKISKAAHKKRKSNLGAGAANDDRSLLAQEKRISTKTLALPSTSAVNAQLSKSSKTSKGKSKTEHKPINPSQRLSSKADSGKRKSTPEPLKANSKKSKTSANGKGKDLVPGKKAVVSDSPSSESSSSTESSSNSTDESGPSNSHSKLNGTLSPVTSPAVINTSKSPLHKRLGKDVHNKTSMGSDSVKLPNGREGKDRTGGTSKSSLFLNGNSKGNGAVRASSSSSSKSSSDSEDETGGTSKSSLFSHGNSKGNGTGRVSLSSLKPSSDTESSSNLSSDNGKSKNAITKDARLSSSSSSLSSSLSSSSVKNKKEKGKLENSKKTSSSLLQPSLLSSPSSLSSPSVLRRIQTEDTNETSVNQSTMSSFTEKTNPLRQKQAQQSTSRRQNKRPDSSHIRFDSEESEEETIEEQSKVCSVNDTTDDLNSTQSSSSSVANKQNHQTRSEKTVSELKEPAKRDYSACTPLHGPPRCKDKIAYKVLELSASYTPEVSNYKEGTVLNFDPSSGAIKIELTKESLKKSQGDGNVTGKFELVFDESEENDNVEEDPVVVVLWNSMIDPVLIE